MPAEMKEELFGRIERDVVGVLLCVYPGECPYSLITGAVAVEGLWRVIIPEEEPRRVWVAVRVEAREVTVEEL